jgi:outer membrane murein-binding lipoprotein Lpp
MIMRRRRPLLRAAAVGGTAYVAGRSLGRRSEQQAQAEDDQNARIGDLEQQQAAPAAPAAPAAAPPAAAGPSLLDQLNQLTTLHQQGALTDDEFTAAKAKLLG